MTAKALTSKKESKNLPELVKELWDMVLAYAKQETVDPIKGLGRYVALGLAGSASIALGLVVLFIGGLRALQTNTGTRFSGHLTWVPYAIGTGASLLVVALAGAAVTRRKARRGRA